MTPLRASQAAVGQRWEDKDWRDSGRVIEIEEIADGMVLARTVATRPGKTTLGRSTRLRVSTLLRRFRLQPKEVTDAAG